MDIAKTAANKIISSLTGRGGFDNAYDMCDEDIQKEIREEIREIVDEAIKRSYHVL